MKKMPIFVAACALALLPLAANAADNLSVNGKPAFAKERFQVRLRLLNVMPSTDSSTTIGGVAQTTKVDAGNSLTPEIDLTYFFTDHVAAEVIAGTSRHKLSFGGTNLGETWLLPPTATLQYHFDRNAKFSPYVGAGINYSMFYDKKAGNGFNNLKISNGFGTALQAGADYWVNRNFGINIDVKKIWLDVDASLNNGAVKSNVDLDPWILGVGMSYRF